MKNALHTLANGTTLLDFSPSDVAMKKEGESAIFGCAENAGHVLVLKEICGPTTETTCKSFDSVREALLDVIVQHKAHEYTLPDRSRVPRVVKACLFIIGQEGNLLSQTNVEQYTISECKQILSEVAGKAVEGSTIYLVARTTRGGFSMDEIQTIDKSTADEYMRYVCSSYIYLLQSGVHLRNLSPSNIRLVLRDPDNQNSGRFVQFTNFVGSHKSSNERNSGGSPIRVKYEKAIDGLSLNIRNEMNQSVAEVANAALVEARVGAANRLKGLLESKFKGILAAP
jgi:hypothetical protein